MTSTPADCGHHGAGGVSITDGPGRDEHGVWLVTGASRGFGRTVAQASLRAGRRVVATADQVEELWPLAAEHGAAVVAMALDLGDELADRETVERVVATFGRIDVVVVHTDFDLARPRMPADASHAARTGLFGALWISQAALSHMRTEGHGHIVQVFDPDLADGEEWPSGLDQVRHAVEGFSGRLAREAASFGVEVTICVPSQHYDAWSASAEGRRYTVVRFEQVLDEG